MMWSSFQDYADNKPATEFFSIRWASEHEKMIDGETGTPDHQASWEALAFGIAIKTWVTEHTLGKVTIIGDAQGVISNLIAMRSRAAVINDVIKEVALHLTPLGLDLLGLHLWAEQNTQADELSRLTGKSEVPAWIHASTSRASVAMIAPQRWRETGTETEFD